MKEKKKEDVDTKHFESIQNQGCSRCPRAKKCRQIDVAAVVII